MMLLQFLYFMMYMMVYMYGHKKSFKFRECEPIRVISGSDLCMLSRWVMLQ